MKPEPFSSEEDQDVAYMDMNCTMEMDAEQYITPIPRSASLPMSSAPSFPAPIYEYADPSLVVKKRTQGTNITGLSSNSKSLYYASTNLKQNSRS